MLSVFHLKYNSWMHILQYHDSSHGFPSLLKCCEPWHATPEQAMVAWTMFGYAKKLVRVASGRCFFGQTHHIAPWPFWSCDFDLVLKNTSSTAQGGGGSFKNRKPIGEVGCCESGMAERSHWWTERCLISLTLSISFSDYLPTYLSIFYVSIYLSIYLSISLSLFHLITQSIDLSIYLSFICLSV